MEQYIWIYGTFKKLSFYTKPSQSPYKELRSTWHGYNVLLWKNLAIAIMLKRSVIWKLIDCLWCYKWETAFHTVYTVNHLRALETTKAHWFKPGCGFNPHVFCLPVFCHFCDSGLWCQCRLCLHGMEGWWKKHSYDYCSCVETHCVCANALLRDSDEFLQWPKGDAD